MFQPDKSINKCDEDILDRASFAKSLAEAILSYKNKDCIVLGLLGTWGSGKTSIINMCIEHINKLTESYEIDKKPIIIKFNPWNYYRQDQLITQFFNNLSSTFKIREIVKKLFTYAKSLIGCFSFKAGPFEISFKNIIVKGQNIEKQKEELNNLLKNLSHKIIVIIDDIDRLSDPEIRQIFQLIKQLGDFPNIIYLVAFDKQVVIKALEKFQEGKGAEYLEKVIQVPFEIPAIPEEKIYNLLLSQLENLTNQEKTFLIFTCNEIKVFFRTIRDVKRYINFVRFNFQLVENEVYYTDFIGITAIQIFFPELYYTIRDNKDLFAGIEVKQDPKYYNEILNMVPENIRENIKQLLINLFPKLERIWGNKSSYSYDYLSYWRSKGRICSPDIFDTYFRLTIPGNEFSQKEIKTILPTTNNPNSFSEALQTINKNGKITRFLERLADYIYDIPKENIESIILVLLDIGDSLQVDENYRSPGFIVNICNKLINELGSHEEKYNILKNAIEKSTKSLFTIVYMVDNILDHESEYIEKKSFTSEEKNKIKEIVLKKIESWANNGQLKNHKKLLYILFRWKEWGHKDKIINFINNMIENDEGLINFITAFLKDIKRSSLSDYTYNSSKVKIDLKEIAEFIEIKNILPRVRNIVNSERFHTFDEKQKIALQTFIDTVDGKIKDNF